MAFDIIMSSYVITSSICIPAVRCFITCWISSWSCVILSICDNSCSIALRFSLRKAWAQRSEFQRTVCHDWYALGQHSLTQPLALTMGNDGGSIPDRRDLVRNKPKVSRNYRRYGIYLNDSLGWTSRQGQPNSSQMVLLCFIKGEQKLEH